MSKAKINEKLNTIREEENFDMSYLDILSRSNDSEESTDTTTKKVLEEIEKRYAENKKN